MKTVKLTINGRQIYAKEGVTILEASQESGIDIPTLCYHSRLRPLGQCRLCLVEVEGLDKPVTACDNPVQEGMVVITDTPALHQAREEILSLLLSTHPFKDCLTCEKSGACELQDKAYGLEVKLPEPLERPLLPTLQEEGPYLVRDEQKCILCGRCIQVCAEVAGRFVFKMVGNGLETRIVPFRDGREVSLEEAGCNFCGQCVDACPVGALLEKLRLRRGREWEFQIASGVCLECSLGCACERRVMNGDIVGITAPASGERFSWLCHKGKFGTAVTDKARVLLPRFRQGDEEREAGWTEALYNAASALNELKSKFGGSSLAVIGNGRCTNEESYLFHRLAREALGTAQIDLGVDPGYARAATALAGEAGPKAWGPSPDALSAAAAILILGNGLAKSHPVAAMAIKHAAHFGGAALIQAVADNGQDSPDTAKDCSALDLPYRPGREAALLSALSAAAAGEECAMQAVEAGLSPEKVSRAAALLFTRGSYTLVTPPFLETLEPGGTKLVQELMHMARVLGQLERGKANLLLLPESSNARGILEAGGSPLCRPGYLAAGKGGLWRHEIAARTREERIKGLILAGSDLLLKIDLSKLELCTVLGTTTVKTNSVTPACLFFPEEAPHEKEGSFTAADGRLRFNRATAARPVMEGWRVLAELGSLLGLKMDYPSLETVREEMWNRP